MKFNDSMLNTANKKAQASQCAVDSQYLKPSKFSHEAINKTIDPTNSGNMIKPMPIKDRALWHDTFWSFILLLTAYLLLALLTFNMSDPSWSRSIAPKAAIQNISGLFGAYWSDIVYYLFGFSAWWGILFALIWLYRNFRPISTKNKILQQHYHFNLGLCGLLILWLCSPIVERLLLKHYLDQTLPVGAGGVWGTVVLDTLSYFKETSVIIMLLLVPMFLAIYLLLQISWLNIMDRAGLALDRFFKNLFRHQHEQTMMQVKMATTNKKNKHAQWFYSQNTQSTVTSSPEFVIKHDTTPFISQKAYQLPPYHLLQSNHDSYHHVEESWIQHTATHIKTRLSQWDIKVEVIRTTTGPVLTCYELQLERTTKPSKIIKLSKELAQALSLPKIRIVETLSNHIIVLEIPNKQRQTVLLQEILTSNIFKQTSSKLTLALGKDITGKPVVGDLRKIPHLLIAGMVNSGQKSEIHAMIVSILYQARPDEVRFILMDSNQSDLLAYAGLPHLLYPIITDTKEAEQTLNWCLTEVEKRYQLMSYIDVRDLTAYNEKVQQRQDQGKPLPNPFSHNPDDPTPLNTLPYIVIIINELSDFIIDETLAIESQIISLTQKARAAGIHMIIATEHPNVNVMTSLIKANIPTRMAFTVKHRVDSRTILDQTGAEDLLKHGDLLFLQPGNAELTRLQGIAINDDEIHHVVSFIQAQTHPNYTPDILTTTQSTNNIDNDELFDEVVLFVISTRKTSISAVQRKFNIGYNRAANLIQALENKGIVSSLQHDGKRTILVNTYPK